MRLYFLHTDAFHSAGTVMVKGALSQRFKHMILASSRFSQSDLRH